MTSGINIKARRAFWAWQLCAADKADLSRPLHAGAQTAKSWLKTCFTTGNIQNEQKIIYERRFAIECHGHQAEGYHPLGDRASAQFLSRLRPSSSTSASPPARCRPTPAKLFRTQS